MFNFNLSVKIYRSIEDEKGNIYLANPDGSEDLVEFNRNERSYKVISRVAQAGHGKYAYLLNG